jgi:Winged helix DNA-binding domain
MPSPQRISEQISDRALGRALLARQGLLERSTDALVDTVEAIGAMQGQAWGALPVGLWSRMASFAPQDLYDALRDDQLRWGIGLRGTLHLVSARQHPAYAVVSAAGATRSWHRAIERTSEAMDEMRAALLAFAAPAPRSNEEIRQFAEAWVGEHPNAIDAREVHAQRELGWRPIYRWSALARAPRQGVWGPKAPADHLAVPIAPGSPRAPALASGLAEVVAHHLRAFGPASAEDVACWIGWRTAAVREILEHAQPPLVRFADEHGATLYDLPHAPRPDADTPAPPRLLGAFDSTLLAYGAQRRQRIVPEDLRDVVYQKANLQIRPTFLLDGAVAGTWSIDVRRREATLTLAASRPVARAQRAALTAEASGLLRALHPSAKAHHVCTGRVPRTSR